MYESHFELILALQTIKIKKAFPLWVNQSGVISNHPHPLFDLEMNMLAEVVNIPTKS